jgi:hypothetical protein
MAHCQPANILVGGPTATTAFRPSGDAGCELICPGYPLYALSDTGVTYGLPAADPALWTTDAPTTQAALKAAFIGISNVAVYCDTCLDEDPDCLQYFQQYSAPEFTIRVTKDTGAAHEEGAWFAPAQDGANLFLSNTIWEPVLEAAGIMVAKDSQTDSVAYVDLVFPKA